MFDLVTLGETMVLINPLAEGPLRYAERFKKQVAGAESNVAIGVSKFGYSTAWLSRLGDDEFGHYIISTLKGEGVDTSRVILSPDSPTGVFFRERKRVGSSQVYYYRNDSAAGFLSPDDLDEDLIKSSRYLHLTGITPALSQSCLETVREAVRIAKENDVRISFDPNLRIKLWKGNKARVILMELIKEIDILLPGLEEAEFLLGKKDNIEEYIKEFVNLGVDIVALKLGKEGCFVADQSNGKLVKGFPMEAVDPVGAGDAFAAGFLAGLLGGDDIYSSARLANASGAFTVTIPGDIEALPTREELDLFLNGNSDIVR